MSLRTIGVSVTLACLMILPVAAEESGRYQLERSESGFARLDTVTGQMSLCRETHGELRCEAAQDDIADLREENAELHDQLRRHADFPSDELPSEEEIEEVATWFERVLVIMARTMRNAEEEIERDEERRR